MDRYGSPRYGTSGYGSKVRWSPLSSSLVSTNQVIMFRMPRASSVGLLLVGLRGVPLAGT